MGGSFSSWVSSFLLYGFGQLIENTDKLVNLRIANLTKIVPTTYNAEKVLLKKQIDQLDKSLENGQISEKEYLQERALILLDGNMSEEQYIS